MRSKSGKPFFQKRFSRGTLSSSVRLYALDVDLAAGEFCGEADVLAFLTDGEGELVTGNVDGCAAFAVEFHVEDFGGREGGCDEFFGLFGELDNVDLFAAEFFDDGADTHTAVTDAGADGKGTKITCKLAGWCDYKAGDVASISVTRKHFFDKETTCAIKAEVKA